ECRRTTLADGDRDHAPLRLRGAGRGERRVGHEVLEAARGAGDVAGLVVGDDVQDARAVGRLVRDPLEVEVVVVEERVRGQRRDVLRDRHALVARCEVDLAAESHLGEPDQEPGDEEEERGEGEPEPRAEADLSPRRKRLGVRDEGERAAPPDAHLLAVDVVLVFGFVSHVLPRKMSFMSKGIISRSRTRALTAKAWLRKRSGKQGTSSMTIRWTRRHSSRWSLLS